MDDCVFCRITAGDIPSDRVYQDEYVTAFRDIEPQAPVHILLVPNEHIGSTLDLEERHEPAMGRLLRAASMVAAQEGIAGRGYRLTINTGRDANQVVQHIHLHLMAGRHFGWPPG